MESCKIKLKKILRLESFFGVIPNRPDSKVCKSIADKFLALPFRWGKLDDSGSQLQFQ